MPGLIYVHGALAMGSGDLIDITNFKVDFTNNGKVISTMRESASGATVGTKECTITFDAVISDQGEEADWIKLVETGKFKQLRAKFPGRDINAIGIYTDVSYDASMDDAIKVSLTFKGKMIL